MGRIKPVRWRVVGLRAKFSVIQKQKDFKANVGVRLFSFSQAKNERRHKVYYNCQNDTAEKKDRDGLCEIL